MSQDQTPNVRELTENETIGADDWALHHYFKTVPGVKTRMWSDWERATNFPEKGDITGQTPKQVNFSVFRPLPGVTITKPENIVRIGQRPAQKSIALSPGDVLQDGDFMTDTWGAIDATQVGRKIAADAGGLYRRPIKEVAA